ncbi:MAG TPA: hypothetical protein VK817_09930 [Trebonia sp.]|jgi:hypothetical protein|nr:hypothetical protein [Trebonia sp.]
MLFPKRPVFRRRSVFRWRTGARLALTVTAAALLSACSHTTTTGAAGAPLPAATPFAVPAATAPATGCTPDYCVPASWDTAAAPTPLPQIKPFHEPLNVIIGARSNVSLSAIQRAAGKWDTVSRTTSVSVAGIRIACISPEKADITGAGYVTEQAAWRLDGCLGGNELSISGAEGHARLWHQDVPGSVNGAWLMAVSYETMCVAEDGGLRAVSAHKTYAALHPSKVYHCVDGGPGSIDQAVPDGYDDGAAGFADAIISGAESKGWHVSQQFVTVPRPQHAGEGGVAFSDKVDVLTITSAK